MKLDARDPLIFAVVAVEEGAGLHRRRVDLATLSRLVVAEHFEVVLEHINNLIRLQSRFNLKSNSIDKFVKFLLMKLCFFHIFFGDFFFLLFIFFFLKIRRIIHR